MQGSLSDLTQQLAPSQPAQSLPIAPPSARHRHRSPVTGHLAIDCPSAHAAFAAQRADKASQAKATTCGMGRLPVR